MNLDKFIQLLSLPSGYRRNGPVHEFIKSELTELGINFNVFDKTTIFNLDIKGAPLLIAHTDTVREPPHDKGLTGNIEYYRVAMDKNHPANEVTVIKSKNKRILGGDDMCGVHIILELLRSGKRFNFVFTDNEENIYEASSRKFLYEFDTDIIENCNYGIIIDRRGNSDIICTANGYGSIDFETAIYDVSKIGGFGFRPTRGVMCDADFFRNVISCANLSAGYYSAHSDKEFVVWEDMENTYNYVTDILNTINVKFPVNQAVFTSFFTDEIMGRIINELHLSGVLKYR